LPEEVGAGWVAIDAVSRTSDIGAAQGATEEVLTRLRVALAARPLARTRHARLASCRVVPGLSAVVTLYSCAPGLFVTPNLDDLIDGTDEKRQAALAEFQALKRTYIRGELLRCCRSVDYPTQNFGSAAEVNITVFRMYRERSHRGYLFDKRNNSSIASNGHDSG
jgi:hypothetical protein